jgi:hypothetical protein
MDTAAQNLQRCVPDHPHSLQHLLEESLHALENRRPNFLEVPKDDVCVSAVRANTDASAIPNGSPHGMAIVGQRHVGKPHCYRKTVMHHVPQP